MTERSERSHRFPRRGQEISVGMAHASESGDSADSIAAVQTLADALSAVLGSHVCERSGRKHRRHTSVRNSVLNDICALITRRLRWELIVPKLYIFGQSALRAARFRICSELHLWVPG